MKEEGREGNNVADLLVVTYNVNTASIGIQWCHMKAVRNKKEI